MYQMYENGKTPTKAIKKEYSKLIALGTGTETKQGIGLGLSYKRKPELIAQARALAQFRRLDFTSDTAKKEYDTQVDKAYKSYLQRHHVKRFTKAQYQQFVEIAGALGDKILEQFGYESIVEVYTSAKQSQRNNLLRATMKVLNENKDKGLNGEDLIDLLHKELSEY